MGHFFLLTMVRFIKVFCFIVLILPLVCGECRNISCYLKDSGTKLQGRTLATWNHRTCSGIFETMGCTRAIGRTPSRCKKALSSYSKGDLEAVCRRKSLKNGYQEFSVYQHGKPRCAGDVNNKNNWMEPENMGIVCCLKTSKGKIMGHSNGECQFYKELIG